LRVMASSSHIPPISATITAAPEEDSGLPQWLDDLLKPGVSNAVFTTLKLSLVGLVLVLCMMLSILEDPTIRMHVSIFLGMSVILLVLIIWFVGELAQATSTEKAEAAAEAKDEGDKKKD